MEMNKELLAKAYVELKGDLNNQMWGFHSRDTIVVQSHQTDRYLSVASLNNSNLRDFTYVCTVEEFNNYNKFENSSESEYILRTEANSKHLAESIKQLETVQESKSPCQTKVNLREAKGTISAMETFMEEVGVLEAWNDNKELYLGGD